MKRVSFLFILLSVVAAAQTIEEKLATAPLEGSTEGTITQVNQRLMQLRRELEQRMDEAAKLYRAESKEEEYSILLQKVRAIKTEMVSLQDRWRLSAVNEARKEEEGYALWDQEETTLAQLVTDYGATDFLYIVPHEMTAMKLTMHSSIPIPRDSWGEVLEIILAHNGIGAKAINPYAKQLFILKQDPSAVQSVASRIEDLHHIQDHRRVFFVFSPPIEHTKTVFQFFERFSDPKQTFVYNVGGKIAIVSSKQEIEKLLNLYRTVWQDPQGKVSKVIPVTKMNVKEMEKILQAFFSEGVGVPGRPPFAKDQDGLSIHTPSQGNALVLMGNREIVERAEKIIKETEEQLQDPAEMAIYLYNCKHSDPIDLAKILDKVYYSLLYAMPESRENLDVNYTARGTNVQSPPDGYSPSPPLIVPPPQFKPEISTKLEIEQNSDHFIPDPKTGNLLMVVRRDVLGRIRDLLRRLDVPKRMVQIEVLLFEKKLNKQTNFGLNLLKLGNTHNGVRYDGPHPPGPHGLNHPVGDGVLAFLVSGKKSKNFPAFDLAYSFLMTQEDIQLNAAPSVITVNQTAATISILEELSLNNGAAPIDSNKGPIFEKSFTRAQYGITIIITPIIHMPDNEDDEDAPGFVTLQTNITFDTTKHTPNDRPPVDKRHIENEVRVVDGQTIILGGLRRKSTQDNENKMPFFGEIPCLGRLFGSSQMTDHNTEMFFFITPKIVTDPKDQLIQLRTESLKKRPGDIPEFLQRLVYARDCERRNHFTQSARILLGDEMQCPCQ